MTFFAPLVPLIFLLAQLSVAYNLRILPLGDSITYGWFSSDGNGYRQDLEVMLEHHGYDIDYIGSVNNPDYSKMADKDNEGHVGWVIPQIIRDGALTTLHNGNPQPDLILLMIGTNDAIQGGREGHTDTYNADQMVRDLATLVDTIFSFNEKACIVISQIIPNKNSPTQALIETYNKNLAYVVQERQALGFKILAVGQGNFNLDDIQSGDETHPNDGGFVKIASNFYLGIQEASSRGWIVPALDDQFKPDEHVKPTGGRCAGSASWGNPMRIWDGYGGADPNAFSPSFAGGSDWSKCGAVQNENGTIHLADVDADGRADFLWVDNNYGTTHVCRNQGAGTFDAAELFAYGFDYIARTGANVKFGDMSGNGRADYFYIHPNGDVELHVNLAPGNFYQNGIIASGFGGTPTTTFIADVNGDGWADLVWVEGSNIYAWLAYKGVAGDNGSVVWTKLGQVASGLGSPDQAVAFADVDGDGRADFLRISSGGAVSVWLNPGSLGANPNFVSSGEFAYGGFASAENVRIADMDGDGRADYDVITDRTAGLVNVDINRGTSNRRTLILQDMNADKRAEFLTMDGNGAVSEYENQADNVQSRGQVHSANGKGPKLTHLADLNGDGGADYIEIDPADCTITVSFNTGLLSFGSPQVAYANPKGANGWPDCDGIRFADYNADGRKDIAYITPDGNVYIYIQQCSGDNTCDHFAVGTWKGYGGPIFYNQPYGRNEIYIADINGDGYGETIGSFAGNEKSAKIYYNGGGTQPGYTVDINTCASTVQGWTTTFADVDGDGRDDWLFIDPATGAIDGCLNICNAETVGGTEPLSDSSGTSIVTGGPSPTALSPNFSPSIIDASAQSTVAPTPAAGSGLSQNGKCGPGQEQQGNQCVDTFHTQPALSGDGFDYGVGHPWDVLYTLHDHCGNLTCDSSWTVYVDRIRQQNQYQEKVTVTVTDADWDGGEVGKQMIEGIINMSHVGATMETREYCSTGDSANDACINGIGTISKAEYWHGLSNFALGRFRNDTTQAGTIHVSVKNADSCSTAQMWVKDVQGALGAVNQGAAFVAPFFGIILDAICAANH